MRDGMSSLRFFATAVAGPICALMNGCALEAPPDPEPVGQVSSRVVLGSASDWSNSMTVTLYQCGWVDPSVISLIFCYVPADELAVGGGVEVEGISPDVLLTGSRPLPDFRGWGAGHGFPGNSGGTPARKRVYVLGLKLAGVSGTALRGMARYKEATSDTADHPSATVEVDEGDWVMVGGGAFASAGQYLTSSWGDIDRWHAGSKDHIVPSPGTITSILIELPTCPDGYVGICLNRYTSWNNGHWVSEGYGANHIWGNQGGYVTTSIGGEASYASAGRMLIDMYPAYLFGGILANARSKDHVFGDSGTTWATTANLHQD